MRPKLEVVADSSATASRFATIFPIVALAFVAVASVAIAQVVRSDRAGHSVSSASLLELTRPLPAFIAEPLGSPVADHTTMPNANFPGRLGDPLTAGFSDTDTRQAGFALLDPPRTIERADFEYGVRFSTPQFDVVQDMATDLLREQIVVHERQGVKTWRWRIAGPGTATLEADGSIALSNGSKIIPPRLYDEQGETLDVPGLAWRLDGREFSLTIDDATLALPYVIDPDTSTPILALRSITTGSPCAAVNGTTILIRSKDCTGAFDVRIMAYDRWQSIDPADTAGLGTGVGTSDYGIQWGPPGAPLNSTGWANWTPAAAARQAGARHGANVSCWNNTTLSGPASGSGIDNRLDYDGDSGILFNTSADNPANAGDPFSPASLLNPLPPSTPPYSNAMSCRWTGYLTGRGSGNYNVRQLVDDAARFDVGAGPDDGFTNFNSCTPNTWQNCNLNSPVTVPTWTNANSAPVNFDTPNAARPFTFT
ncbi:MAG: hypothetical protein ACR2H3_01270, partial [Acidimicrobiales bacterium]